jgi:hypothetical protein
MASDPQTTDDEMTEAERVSYQPTPALVELQRRHVENERRVQELRSQTTKYPMSAADHAAADADNNGVASFSEAMRRKLGKTRAKGRGGWQQCANADLWQMLREHIDKGDPVDIGNFAMMIHQNMEAGRG